MYVASSDGVWKSENLGQSFTLISDPEIDNYGAFAVSDIDTNYMLLGNIDTHRSTDGGLTFNQATYWSTGNANYDTTGQYVHADIRGARSNQLFGYGIVTGLAGQGDSRIEYTELGILNALERLGIRADKADKSRNIAAVMVTANIGPFAKEGSRMDVTVSSIGNADSLQGGILLQTPLQGADGKVYSVAQGAVSIGGLSAGNAGGANVQVNHPRFFQAKHRTCRIIVWDQEAY